jgi:proteic killer suppression protein
MVIQRVELSARAKKQLRKVPVHVADKLMAWVASVEAKGLEEVRKLPGYHDEPLKGERRGQRSIRLSRAYRAIYVIAGQQVAFVSVEEVSKHDY